MSATARMEGLGALLAGFDALIGRVTDISWFWNEDFEHYVFELQSAHFDSGGGGIWDALDETYAARKAVEYPGQPIMVREERLRTSMEQPKGAAGGIWDAQDTSLAAGSNLPYANAQNLGDPNRNLPTRPLWSPQLLEGDGLMEMWVEQLADYARGVGFELI